MDKPSGERARSQTAPKEKERAKDKFHEKGTTTRTRLDLQTRKTGQRKLNDFGIERQRVQFVGDVHEHGDGFETPTEESSRLRVLCSQLQKRYERMSGCAKFVGDLRRAGE